MQTVLTETRYVEHKRAFEGFETLCVNVFEVGIDLAFVECSCEVILPVRTVLDFVHLLARNHGERTSRGWCLKSPLAFQ